MSDDNGVMTRREREDLAKFARRQEKVAKTSAKRRSAELMADFEQQLATIYKPHDERWREVIQEAERAVAEGNKKLEAICREAGIRKEFGPGFGLVCWGRGENAVAERRGELRKVAASRIEAMEQEARERIERDTVEVERQLLVGGLETDAARAFLESMPTVEQLMPKFTLAELKATRGKPMLPTASEVADDQQ